MSSSLLDEIRKLSLAERIQLVQDVWDSIAAEGEEFPIPESHRAEIARRREEHRQSPEDVVPWEEVRRQLWAEDVRQRDEELQLTRAASQLSFIEREQLRASKD